MSESEPLLPSSTADTDTPPAKSRWSLPNSGQVILFVELLAFLAALGGVGFWIWGWQMKGNDDTLHWRPCYDHPEFLCTTFDVPTDYTDPSAGTTRLAMTKLPASTLPRLGSLTTNYGGPGGSGYSNSFRFGPMIHALAGGRYDLISWDPRGIGRTIPAVNCHGDALRAEQFRANTLLESTFEVPKDPSGKEGRAVLVRQQKEVLALWEAQAGLCGRNVGAEVLKHFGTTTLVKDIARIVDVLDGVGADIHFHGGSYGTVVADYLVNMLPHRVGKVISHGVATPPVWATEDYENYHLLALLLDNAENTLNPRAAYSKFYDQCFDAGPSRCALAKKGDGSGQDIMARVDQYLNDLYEHPLPVLNGTRPGLLKSGMVKNQIFNALQFPEAWQSFASSLASAISGSPGSLAASSLRELAPTPVEADGYSSVNQGDLQRLGVSCADAPGYADGMRVIPAEEMVDSLLGIVKNVSRHFGATVNLMEQHGGCQFWPRSNKPVERFTGPWNSTLKNTILVVSNQDDPITPAPAGKEQADRFGDKARHLIQPGIGHSYLVPPSECYSKIAKKYFEEGVLPDGKTIVCKGEPGNNFPAGHGHSSPPPLL